jgi:hypothetical protein
MEDYVPKNALRESPQAGLDAPVTGVQTRGPGFDELGKFIDGVYVSC